MAKLRLGKPLPPAALAEIARVSGADLAAKPASKYAAKHQAAVAAYAPQAVAAVKPPKLPPPTPAEAEAQRIAWRVADLAHCRERWPVLFDPDHPLPLAIGIHKQLGPVLGIKRAARLLEWWCRAWRPYGEAVARGGQRYNLDGSEAEEITEQARIIAREMWNKPGIAPHSGRPKPTVSECVEAQQQREAA
jgi:hypothetical protein